MKCLNCAAEQPATHSGPDCFNCGAVWTRCSCARPIKINDKKFMPSRNATCPIHGDCVFENPESPDHPSPDDVLRRHQEKVAQAGLYGNDKRFGI